VLTGFAAGDISAVDVGYMVRFSSATNHYCGRIIAKSGTTITVSPTPSVGFNTGGVTWVMAPNLVPLRRAIASPIIGARALTVWGERVILGGIAYDALNAGTKLDVHANRVAWGLLPAVESAVTGGITFDGCREGGIDTFLASDFTDIMGLETLLGLEPVNQGELLVLGYPRCYRIVGTFSTLTTQAGGANTWETRPLQDVVAAISDKATATTPIGIMFAAADGIYLYRNGKAENVLDGRRRKEYRAIIASLVAGGTAIEDVISGGGYIGNNHYVVFFNGSAGGMVCNMDRGGFRWNGIGGGFGGGGLTNIVADPTRPPSMYVAPYKDAATNSTRKLLRVEQFFTPDATNQSDAQGSGPTPTVVTRAYTEGDPARLKVFKAIEVVVRLKRAAGGATCAISVTGGLDAEETPTVLTAINSNTSGAAQMVRYSFPVRVISKALTISFQQTGSKPDEFEIVSVKIDSEPLNETRSV
jgi:hypothetical protein